MQLKKKFLRSRKHLDFIKEGKCIICFNSPCDPAHLTGFRIGGIGLKPDDCFVVPLCRDCHNKSHHYGERSFWEKNGIEPFSYAIQYCMMSPCEKIKENYKEYFQEKVVYIK